MPPVFSKEIKDKFILASGLPFQPRTSPCEVHCPAGNPIQKMNALAEEGRLEEALEYILCRNPFPAVTGRICPHPCESACNRDTFDSGISIRAIERFTSDFADPALMASPRKKEASGKKIAIVGSGPAGLTCAYFSALFGHDVTVFESEPTIGGLPRNAVPDFRLPKDIMAKEVGRVLSLGVHVRTNVTVGHDVTLEAIAAEFDACVIAVGSGRERSLTIPGGDLAQPAVAWLKMVNLAHNRTRPGERVAVIGGGGVAFDAAFTAKRLGAREVSLVCLEGPGSYCVSGEDVRQAESEGIRIIHSSLPRTLISRANHLIGLELTRVSSFCFDQQGRLAVDLADNGVQVIEVDAVLCAIGLQPDFALLGGPEEFDLTPKGCLNVDPVTMETSRPGFFAAGDAVSGPATVAAAVGGGRRVAAAVDRFLVGERDADRVRIMLDQHDRVTAETAPIVPPPHVVAFEDLLNVDHFDQSPRRATVRRPETRSALSFDEIDLGFDPEDASAEAGRCFHCGHCIACGACVDDCPGHILAMTPDGPKVAYPDECWHCGCCRISCPRGAILYKFPLNMML